MSLLWWLLVWPFAKPEKLSWTRYYLISRRDKMEESKKNYSGGIGFTGLLTIVFITLKLCKVIDWSWVWVLSPIWIMVAAVIVVAIVAILIVVISAANSDKDKKTVKLE
jgi:hypothetical protein